MVLKCPWIRVQNITNYFSVILGLTLGSHFVSICVTFLLPQPSICPILLYGHHLNSSLTPRVKLSYDLTFIYWRWRRLDWLWIFRELKILRICLVWALSFIHNLCCWTVALLAYAWACNTWINNHWLFKIFLSRRIYWKNFYDWWLALRLFISLHLHLDLTTWKFLVNLSGFVSFTILHHRCAFRSETPWGLNN